MKSPNAAILGSGQDAVHELAAEPPILPARFDREGGFGILCRAAEDAAQFGRTPDLAIDEDGENGGIEPESGIDIGVDEFIARHTAEAQPPGLGVKPLQMRPLRRQIAHP